MSTTLTIRNLAEPVKQKLRMQAASHGRSMEAEAREILTLAVAGSEVQAPVIPASSKGKFDHLIGIWKDRGTTDELMRELRGED
ncbi:MAG: plasmid stabilization protein [Verrucomicrobiota bacterium]